MAKESTRSCCSAAATHQPVEPFWLRSYILYVISGLAVTSAIRTCSSLSWSIAVSQAFLAVELGYDVCVQLGALVPAGIGPFLRLHIWSRSSTVRHSTWSRFRGHILAHLLATFCGMIWMVLEFNIMNLGAIQDAASTALHFLWSMGSVYGIYSVVPMLGRLPLPYFARSGFYIAFSSLITIHLSDAFASFPMLRLFSASVVFLTFVLSMWGVFLINLEHVLARSNQNGYYSTTGPGPSTVLSVWEMFLEYVTLQRVYPFKSELRFHFLTAGVTCLVFSVYYAAASLVAYVWSGGDMCEALLHQITTYTICTDLAFRTIFFEATLVTRQVQNAHHSLMFIALRCFFLAFCTYGIFGTSAGLGVLNNCFLHFPNIANAFCTVTNPSNVTHSLWGLV